MTLRSKFAAGAGTALIGAFALSMAFSLPARAEDKDAAGGASSSEQPAAHPHIKREAWSFRGPFGKFDRAQLQRGYQVYKDVCATCHSMRLVAFRDLESKSGPAFSEGQVKALAATFQMKDGPNASGEMFERPGVPSDYFPSPFANPQAAGATLGAIPPDLSVIAKARDVHSGFPGFIFDAFIQYQEGGPDYIHALLTGYSKPDDPNFNTVFPGNRIAMPPPLSDGAVAYTDGSPQTLDQYSKDVTAFLMWAAEPKLEARKSLGFAVILYLIVFAGLLYAVKKRLWARVGPH